MTCSIALYIIICLMYIYWLNTLSSPRIPQWTLGKTAKNIITVHPDNESNFLKFYTCFSFAKEVKFLPISKSSFQVPNFPTWGFPDNFKLRLTYQILSFHSVFLLKIFPHVNTAILCLMFSTFQLLVHNLFSI